MLLKRENILKLKHRDIRIVNKKNSKEAIKGH